MQASNLFRHTASGKETHETDEWRNCNRLEQRHNEATRYGMRDAKTQVDAERAHLLERLSGTLRRQCRLIGGRGHELPRVPALFLDVGQLRVHDLVSVGALLDDGIMLHLPMQ